MEATSTDQPGGQLPASVALQLQDKAFGVDAFLPDADGDLDLRHRRLAKDDKKRLQALLRGKLHRSDGKPKSSTSPKLNVSRCWCNNCGLKNADLDLFRPLLPSVTHLSLSGNELTDKCAKTLSRILTSSDLVYLSLRDNKLGSRIGKPLAKALSSSKVQELSLEGNCIGDTAAEQILRTALSPASRLRALNLQATGVTSHVLTVLSSILSPLCPRGDHGEEMRTAANEQSQANSHHSIKAAIREEASTTSVHPVDFRLAELLLGLNPDMNSSNTRIFVETLAAYQGKPPSRFAPTNPAPSSARGRTQPSDGLQRNPLVPGHSAASHVSFDKEALSHGEIDSGFKTITLPMSAKDDSISAALLRRVPLEFV